MLLLRQRELGLLVLELGLLRAELRLVRLDVGAVHGGIDLGDELPRLDPRSDVDVQRLELDEKKFRYLLNDDAMATEKTAEGIRKFAADIVKLEALVAKKLA